MTNTTVRIVKARQKNLFQSISMHNMRTADIIKNRLVNSHSHWLILSNSPGASPNEFTAMKCIPNKMMKPGTQGIVARKKIQGRRKYVFRRNILPSDRRANLEKAQPRRHDR